MRWLLFQVFLLPTAWLAAALISTGALELRPVSLDEGPQEASPCGRQLFVSTDDGRVLRGESTRVVLALDEEWRARFQDESNAVARSLLGEASSLFRGLHIHLLPVRTESWVSPDSVDSAEGLLSAARAAVSLDEADIVVALTGQPLTQADGRAEIGGRYALVRHHPGKPERDAMVLAHEVAHLFGANHGCDLPGHSGLMAKGGFEEPGLICPCTQQVLERNAARFHIDSSVGVEGDRADQ